MSEEDDFEKIVLKLEDDSINLEESVQSFEDGIELVKKCQTWGSKITKQYYKY